MDEKLINYLRETLPKNDLWVNQLEQQAKEGYIPIMDSLSMNFVMQLIRITQPKRILEVGTAIGYSALRMLEAYPNAHIVSIEQDDYRHNEAVKNIHLQNKQANIELIHGDALEILPLISSEPFDLILIDASKGKYQEFFELSSPLLNESGVILTDNVLFRGYIFGLIEVDPKYRNLVEKIKIYNKWLINLPHFTTSIVPIGDGIAMSYKLGNEGSKK